MKINTIKSILPHPARGAYWEIGIQISLLALMGYLAHTALNKQLAPALGFASVLALCFLVNKPQLGLYLLTISLFGLDFVSSHGLVPQATTWFSELLLAAYALRLLGHLATERTVLRKSVGRIDFWVILMLWVALLSALVSEQHPIVTLLGLRGYFKYLLFFYLILNLNFSLRFLQKIYHLFWLLLFTQPVAVAVQAWIYSAHGAVSADSNGGTMAGYLGGTSLLSIITGMAGALGFAYFLETKRKNYLILAVLLLIVLGLAEAKGGYVFFGLGLFSVLFFYSLRRRSMGLIWKLVLPVVLLTAGLKVSADLASSHSRIDIGKILKQFTTLYELAGQMDFTENQESFRTSQESGESLGLNVSYIDRMADMQMAVRYVADKPLGGLLGSGPGAGSVSHFRGFSGAIYKQYQETYGKISDVFWTQFSRTLVELGYAGLVAHLGLYFGVFSLAYRHYMTCSDPSWRACTLSLMGFVGIIFLGTFYHRIGVMDPILFIFWLSAALIVIRRRQERASSLDRESLFANHL
jgi:hypothetical protein